MVEDGVAHLAEIVVQHLDHVVRRQRLGERRERTQVAEQDGAIEPHAAQSEIRIRPPQDLVDHGLRNEAREQIPDVLALEQAYDALAEGLDLRAVADQIAERAVHRGHHTAAGRAVQPTVQDLTTHSLTTGQRSATC